MDDCFILIGYDGQNYNGPIAKRQFPSFQEAADHAKIVMGSGGSQNLHKIYIMQACAVAERVAQPVEITPILREEVSKAA